MTQNNDRDRPTEMNGEHKQLKEPPSGAISGDNDSEKTGGDA